MNAEDESRIKLTLVIFLTLEGDLVDLKLGIRLSVADLLLFVLLGLVLQNVDLLTLAVLDDGSFDNGTLDIGSTGNETCVGTCSKNRIKCNGVAVIDFELFGEYDVAFLDLVLLSAGYENSKHEKHLSFN